MFAGIAALLWYFGLLGAILQIIGYLPVVVIIAIALILIGVILIRGAFLIGENVRKSSKADDFSEFDRDEVLYGNFDGREDRKRF